MFRAPSLHRDGSALSKTPNSRTLATKPEPIREILAGETRMLETIAIILIVLWLLGLVSSATMGGFIHVLLVIAIILIVLRVIRG
jgi:hypothetical protein